MPLRVKRLSSGKIVYLTKQIQKYAICLLLPIILIPSSVLSQMTKRKHLSNTLYMYTKLVKSHCGVKYNEN